MTQGPTAHQVWAAVRVARLLDVEGNEVGDVHHSYARAITLGEHPVDHLRDGEQLLIRAGLAQIVDGRLRLTPGLHEVAALPDIEAVSVFSQALGWLPIAEDDSDLRAAYGAAGERHVVDVCRKELAELHRADLVLQVRQVSLITDAAGYDVFAPVIAGLDRRLEVKTCRPGPTLRFFLTRHEWETGRNHPDSWALVVCGATGELGPDLVVEVLGWCRADSLRTYLPDDAAGRWTEALVHLPRALLAPGLPAPV